MSDPPVTICIPAWNAEEFIDRTLRCARNQTFPDIVIRVSIDLSEDSTEEICRAHAAEDDRIEVITQTSRLGWAGNANALLDLVDTEYAFLYFHDDEIEPEYAEVLMTALESHADAMSAHGDYEGHGRRSDFIPAHTYRGRDAKRILTHLVGRDTGSLLRSMVRRSALDSGLRFPIIGVDGPWRAWPFGLHMVALGPAIGVNRLLYRRWLRDGSLTVNWRPRSMEDLIEGQREQAALSLAIIDAAEATDSERSAMRYGLLLQMLDLTRRTELRLGHGSLTDPAELASEFAGLTMTDGVCDLDSKTAAWIRDRQVDLLVLEAVHARHHARQLHEASRKLQQALRLQPGHPRAVKELALLPPSANPTTDPDSKVGD